MPNVGTGREGLAQPLYDSVVLDGTQTTAVLFQQPVGQAGKTKYHTNMRLAGQLQKPETYDVFAICAGSLPGVGKTNIAALMTGWLSLIVGNKVYYETLLQRLTAGGGLFINTGTLGSGQAVDYSNFGYPDARNIHSLKVPVNIAQSEHFRVEVNWLAAPAQDLLFWVRFEGVLKRSIQ